MVDARKRNLKLFKAVGTKNLEEVKRLLDGGADPNFGSSGGDSVLVFAASTGSAEIVRVLIDKGANVDVSSGGNSALVTAVATGSTEIVRVLIDKGANVDGKGAGTTPYPCI